MTWVGLGKIVVATAGTGVFLSAVKLKVHSVLVTYDGADTGSILVKDVNGGVIAALNANSNSPVLLESLGADEIDLNKIQIDVTVNGKGPYVGYSIA